MFGPMSGSFHGTIPVNSHSNSWYKVTWTKGVVSVKHAHG